MALMWISTAWASYGQMRLDGVTFLLAALALYMWSFALAVMVGVKLGKYRIFVVAASAATVALAILLLAVFGDGKATMNQRPLGGGAVFVILLLAAVPAMLAAPVLQLARGISSRLPLTLLVGALVLVHAGTALHLLLQYRLEDRAQGQARTLAPGQLLPHVTASRQRAADSRLSPYVWNEQAELKWIVIGLNHLPFIESPTPLSDEDAQALALLVKLSAGTESAHYTWRLEGKLFWDRLVRAAAEDRPAVAAGLTKQQAGQFVETIGVPHVDWLCTPLAEPHTEKAFGHVWTLLSAGDKQRFGNAIQEKCGRPLATPARRR
jgi:hypothetical protein